MIELEKYEDMVAKKARQINKLKKQIKELSSPEQTESFYKIEYYKLLDDIEEFKQIEYDLTQENEELKQELADLLIIVSGVN